MIYALDTNALIAWQKGHEVFMRHYEGASQQAEIAVPSFVRFEARRELANLLYQRRLAKLDSLLSLHSSLDLDAESVDISVSLYDILRSDGNLIDDADLLIAGIVIRNDAILITNNTAHFERIPNIKLMDWQQESPKLVVGVRKP